MTATRMDSVARFFARRRQATQDDGTPVADDPQKTPYLFVQSYQAGSIVANTGTYTLTLEQGYGQTVYFSDRPGREVGIVPTPDFLSGIGFPEQNPPNAALVVEDADGSTEIAVLELFDPTYDEATQTATYQVKPLEAWATDGIAFQDAPADLSALTGPLGASHLFIDDCPNDQIRCRSPYYGDQMQTIGTFDNQPFCYNYVLCIPCEPYYGNPPDRCSTVHHWNDRCNAEFAACNGACTADFNSVNFLCWE